MGNACGANRSRVGTPVTTEIDLHLTEEGDLPLSDPLGLPPSVDPAAKQPKPKRPQAWAPEIALPRNISIEVIAPPNCQAQSKSELDKLDRSRSRSPSPSLVTTLEQTHHSLTLSEHCENFAPLQSSPGEEQKSLDAFSPDFAISPPPPGLDPSPPLSKGGAANTSNSSFSFASLLRHRTPSPTTLEPTSPIAQKESPFSWVRRSSNASRAQSPTPRAQSPDELSMGMAPATRRGSNMSAARRKSHSRRNSRRQSAVGPVTGPLFQPFCCFCCAMAEDLGDEELKGVFSYYSPWNLKILYSGMTNTQMLLLTRAFAHWLPKWHKLNIVTAPNNESALCLFETFSPHLVLLECSPAKMAQAVRKYEKGNPKLQNYIPRTKSFLVTTIDAIQAERDPDYKSREKDPPSPRANHLESSPNRSRRRSSAVATPPPSSQHSLSTSPQPRRSNSQIKRPPGIDDVVGDFGLNNLFQSCKRFKLVNAPGTKW